MIVVCVVGLISGLEEDVLEEEPLGFVVLLE